MVWVRKREMFTSTPRPPEAGEKIFYVTEIQFPL